MANAPFMDGEKRINMSTTSTEEEIRQLDFRGLKMFQVLKHDILKVIAEHIDSKKPVMIKPGQVWHNKNSDDYLFVTAHTSEISPVHWIQFNPRESMSSMQKRTSQWSRANFEDSVRSGQLTLQKFNGER